MSESRINCTEISTEGRKAGIQKKQFAGIEDKDLRCRNIAVMILNYYEDHGEDVALEYSAVNITDADEGHVRSWVQKLAEERGIWGRKH